jgi:BirA family transcriptional regulator, biotin operon repressor / biotin---[acetyl-CoA-carboxylase] ligase
MSYDPAAIETALRARSRLGRVEVVQRSGSTSSDLVAAAGDVGAWPDRSVLVADHQTQGRGRAGRSWETPPGTALTFSVLVRPEVSTARFGWLPLLGGLAVLRALAAVGAEAALKWPNDVLLPESDGPAVPGWGIWRKVAGVLGDLVPGGAVIGIGVNVGQDRLPVPHATSLRRAGFDVPRTELLAEVVGAFVELEERWRAADGDAVTAGLAAECARACVTIGSPVRVHRPDGILAGTAAGLSDDGALLVVDDTGHEHEVLAGDVEHLR